jgi:hypothetical protein
LILAIGGEIVSEAEIFMDVEMSKITTWARVIRLILMKRNPKPC